MSRLDVTAVKLLLNDIGNDVTKLELTKKPAVYQHVLECLAAHAQALVQLVTAPLARGTLEMPRLEGGGALPQAVPEAITADEPTAHQLPRQAQAGGDDFSEAPTLTGREA